MAIADDNPQVKVKCIEFIDTGNSSTPFIRNYVYDECGELESTFDIDQDGNPYTVVGPYQKPGTGTTVLDVTGIETTTTLVDNGNGTFTYTSEDSTATIIDYGDSDHGALTGLLDDDHTQYLTEARHDALPFDNPHNVNANQVGLGNVPNVDATNRANHTGTQTASTISDFLAAVQAAETVTGLGIAGNVLQYTKEDGTLDTVDLSTYLDDTNLSRLTSGTIDPITGIATFTRDDSSTFTVDFSSLLGDSFSIYEVYQIGTTSLNGTYQVINMNTEESAQTGYSQSGGGVQVSDAGRYKLTYSVSADSTDGDRADSRSAIHINGTELVRSRAYAYHRNVATGEGTANKTVTVNLAANAVVDVRTLIFGDNVETITQASNLIVEKIG